MMIYFSFMLHDKDFVQANFAVFHHGRIPWNLKVGYLRHPLPSQGALGGKRLLNSAGGFMVTK